MKSSGNAWRLHLVKISRFICDEIFYQRENIVSKNYSVLSTRITPFYLQEKYRDIIHEYAGAALSGKYSSLFKRESMNRCTCLYIVQIIFILDYLILAWRLRCGTKHYLDITKLQILQFVLSNRDYFDL